MRISARIRSIPVVIDSRLYLFWPVFFEKQIAGVDVLSNSAMQDAKEAQIEYDEYLDYLLYYELQYEIVGFLVIRFPNWDLHRSKSLLIRATKHLMKY